MDYKWIGAVLIVSACGGFGFSLCCAHRAEEEALKQLIRALDFMASELHYRSTPLPELCLFTSKECARGVDKVFYRLSRELEQNQSPDVGSSMDSALKDVNLPPKALQNFNLLGKSLGRFDLEGQLKGLEAVRDACRKDLNDLHTHRDQRMRNYQTLSLCAGAALAILLI